MNAYELADYLDNNVEAMLFTEQPHLDNAANMLRQQADRITELEAEISNRTWVRKLLTEEKQSEPVAWIKQGKYGYPMLVFNGVFKYDSIVVKQPDIPLYTTPQTKPLSDEEIAVIWMNNEIPLSGFLFRKIVRIIEAKVRGQ